MADINGGEIKYTASFDISQLKKALTDGEGRIKGFTEVVEKSGKTIDDVFDATKENISIQKEVIAELESQYKALQKQIENMAPGKAKLAVMGEAAGIAKDIEAEKKALTELEERVMSNAQEHESLRSKLTNAKNAMAELVNSGQKNSQQYNELKKKAGEYQNALNDINSEMRTINNSRGLDTLISSMGLASGILSTGVGAMSLFSGQSERLEQIMVKLQSVMAVVIGVQQISNTVNNEGALIQGIVSLQATARARSEALATAGTIRATIAQRAFNLVAKANPYVLLAVAIGTLVGALYLFSQKSNKAAEDQKKLNDSVADSVAEPIMAYKKLQLQWQNLGNDLKKKQKYVDDNKDAFYALGVEVNNVTDAENVLVKNSENFVKSLEYRAKAMAAMQIATEEYKQSLKEENSINKFDEDWKNSNLFGKIGLSAKAIFTNIDDTKSNKLSKSADDWVKKSTGFGIIEDYYKKIGGFKVPQLGKTDTTSNKVAKSPKSVADEYLPLGSVAELQRRLSEIDKLLSKSTNEKEISSLKDKRIELSRQLTEAEKKIEILSITEQISSKTKLWEQYYDATSKLGIDKAKELYKGLLDQDENYYAYLKKTQDDLLKIPVGKLTPEQKEALQIVTNAMDTMTGKIQPVEKFNNELEQTLSTFTTTAEKIQYLQKIVDENNNSDGYSNGKYASALSRLNDEKRNLTSAYNEMYAQFKMDYQNFEVQKTQIAERWARIRSTIESRFNNGEIDNAEKLRQLNNAGQAEAEEYSKGFMDKLSNNPNYQKAFANIGALSIKDLKNIRNKLQQELELLKKSGKGTPEAIEALKRKIQEFDYITGNKNPFEIFKDAIKALGDESVSTEDKLWKLGEAGAALSAFSNLFKSTISDIKGAAEDLGFSLDNEIGDVLDKMQSMMEGFDQIGQGMQQFATGGPIGMVTGSIKMIGGLIKSISGWFNNDKKKERQIKAWANEVNNLKNAYADLEQQIKKALGEDVYKKQQEEITNLRRQQQLIQQMSAKEADKKKKDQGKIDDYNRQIQDINRQIEDIQNSITERVLQTTAKDAAKQLGDILVDNFGRAEDAAKSLEDYTNTIFKNIVKNALSMRLEEKMQPVLDDMLKAVGFDKEGKGTFKPLSKEQYDEFKKKIADVAKYGQDVAGMFSDMFDNITIQDPKGLEGAVKTISSQEAGELVAQFNASRIIHGKQLEVMLQNQPTFKDMLAQLVAIEFNTRRLHKMADDLADLNRKITKGSDLFMSGL
ncbi:hypothetical protein HZP34_18495 [Elizabethkingia anophelis]|nr:hypothetical protein [Elizabethkingia anophelis]